MMKNDDVAIIQRVLAGDETAFAELVKKHQKPVHTLAWQKIGDFHIAEDITQDTFLKVYQRLSTLKNPSQFSGWLYVITTRLCATWLRKNRIQTEPLEDTDISMIDADAYSRHITEDRHKTAVDAQRETVRKLLAKLKESERTVMTLHYLGEMTIEEISRFLGVSGSTIKSRLRRARNRLQKEETMIREALEHFQISPNLTDNIMQEVARLKPTPSGSKPLIPWAVAASTAVLIALMLGIGNQHLARFQKPYSLDAQSEMSVELVEAPIVQDIIAEPEVRNQVGNTNAVGKSDTPKKNPDEVLLAAAEAEGENSVKTKQQWIQSASLAGSSVQSLLSTPDGDLYTFARGDIFKLPANGDTWQHVFDISTLNHSGLGNQILLKKWNNTLYYTQSSDLFASTDDGKTWKLLYSWQEKHQNPIELILTERALYMAFDSGIFRSKDKGKTWKKISDRLTGIDSLIEVKNTFFAGTDNGFYRLEADSWKRLEFPESIGWMPSVTASEGRLYVLAEVDLDVAHPAKVSEGHERGWWIFRSTDLGDSWKDITPTNAWTVNGFMPEAKLIAVGETLLLMEKGMVRSTDGGNTWMPPQLPGTSPEMSSFGTAVVVNTDTIYIGSWDGLHRSIDAGKSWEIINITPDESGIDHLITFNRSDSERNLMPTLYARFGSSIVTTSDQGKSWKNVQVEIPMTEPHREEPPSITHIVNYGGVIYAKGGDFPHGGDSFGKIKTLLYRVSKDGNTLVPVQGMPFFDSGPLQKQLSEKRGPFFDASDKEYIKQLQEKAHGATQFFEQLAKWDPHQPDVYMQLGFRTGPFAVSNDTFYVEYNYKLFRWKLGETEWYDTGIEETGELNLKVAMRNLKLAASGNTIYVGKRDGHLVVSFDKGTNWIDLTPALPFQVNDYKEILFAGTTVYVATDAGIITSGDGRRWNTITDTAGDNLIMEHLANDGNTLYGVKDTGIYRLESGTWENVVSEMPESVTSLAADGKTLYVGTETQGMLHYTLE